MSCGVGCRGSSDLSLLWLWYRAAAAAPVQPLAWQPLYAAHAALKKKKKKMDFELCPCLPVVIMSYHFQNNSSNLGYSDEES